jgi:hypothetical protein
MKPGPGGSDFDLCCYNPSKVRVLVARIGGCGHRKAHQGNPPEIKSSDVEAGAVDHFISKNCGVSLVGPFPESRITLRAPLTIDGHSQHYTVLQ